MPDEASVPELTRPVLAPTPDVALARQCACMALPGGHAHRVARKGAHRLGASAIAPAAVTELPAVVCTPARDLCDLRDDTGMPVARRNRRGGTRQAGDSHGRRAVEPRLIAELTRVVRSPTAHGPGAGACAGVPAARGYPDCAGQTRDAQRRGASEERCCAELAGGVHPPAANVACTRQRARVGDAGGHAGRRVESTRRRLPRSWLRYCRRRAVRSRSRPSTRRRPLGAARTYGAGRRSRRPRGRASRAPSSVGGERSPCHCLAAQRRLHPSTSRRLRARPRRCRCVRRRRRLLATPPARAPGRRDPLPVRCPAGPSSRRPSTPPGPAPARHRCGARLR